MFRVSFLPLDETQLFESCGGFFIALKRFLDTRFIGLGFATADPSLEVLP